MQYLTLTYKRFGSLPVMYKYISADAISQMLTEVKKENCEKERQAISNINICVHITAVCRHWPKKIFQDFYTFQMVTNKSGLFA